MFICILLIKDIKYIQEANIPKNLFNFTNLFNCTYMQLLCDNA